MKGLTMKETFFLWILEKYRAHLERQIVPENYDRDLSRKIELVTALLDNR